MHITETIGRWPHPARVLAGTALLAGIGTVNATVGTELSLAAFYLVPVTFFAWFVSGWMGIAAAIGSAALTLLPHLRAEVHYHEPTAPYWNALMHLGIFLFSAFILSEVKGLYEREKRLSRHDFLTGTLNERAFAEVIAEEQSRAARYGYPVTVAYMDLDDFKLVNDRYGHSAGDAALRTLGAALLGAVRDSDTVARVGGDEFVILLPQTGTEASQAVLQKLTSVLRDAMQQSGSPVTFSIGAVTFASPPPPPAEMIKKADEAMYAVKGTGKHGIKMVEESKK